MVRQYWKYALLTVLIVSLVSKEGSKSVLKEQAYESPFDTITCVSGAEPMFEESRGSNTVTINNVNIVKLRNYTLSYELAVEQFSPNGETLYPVLPWDNFYSSLSLSNNTATQVIQHRVQISNSTNIDRGSVTFLAENNWNQLTLRAEDSSPYRSANIKFRLTSLSEAAQGSLNTELPSNIAIVPNLPVSDTEKLDTRVIAMSFMGRSKIDGLYVKLGMNGGFAPGLATFSLWKEGPDKSKILISDYKASPDMLVQHRASKQKAVRARFEDVENETWYLIPLAAYLKESERYLVMIDLSVLPREGMDAIWISGKETGERAKINDQSVPLSDSIILSSVASSDLGDPILEKRSEIQLGQTPDDWARLSAATNAAENVLYNGNARTVLGRAIGGVSYTYKLSYKNLPNSIRIYAEQNCEGTLPSKVQYSFDGQIWIQLGEEGTGLYSKPNLGKTISSNTGTELFIKVELDTETAEQLTHKFFGLSKLTVNVE